MTNGSEMLPPLCSCPSGGSRDLIPLLVVAAVVIGLRFAIGWLRKKGKNPVKNVKQVVIVVALIAAVGAVFALKKRPAVPVATPAEPSVPTVAEKPAALPRLVDLGADKCVPCKMMAPILEEMKKTYAGQLQVDFLDVWKNPGAGQEYGIRVIPTQIFFGPDGKELARHEGFMSREDILAQWAKLGSTFKDQRVE